MHIQTRPAIKTQPVATKVEVTVLIATETEIEEEEKESFPKGTRSDGEEGVCREVQVEIENLLVDHLVVLIVIIHRRLRRSIQLPEVAIIAAVVVVEVEAQVRPELMALRTEREETRTRKEIAQ